MGHTRTKNRLFDDIIGAGRKRWWHIDVQRSRGLEIDYKFKFGCLYHRQIGDCCTFKKAADIYAGLIKAIVHASSVAGEAANCSEVGRTD